jgi:hypothetical protein
MGVVLFDVARHCTTHTFLVSMTLVGADPHKLVRANLLIIAFEYSQR